jgi:hypothetical protein
MESDISFEQALEVAIGRRGLNGLTFWLTHEKKWQVSARFTGSDGFRVATMHDPITAAKIVLHNGLFGASDEMTADQRMRIETSINRLLMALHLFNTPIEEDEEL